MSGKALHPDHSDFFRALGQRIRALRKERSWTLRDMVIKHSYHVSQWQAYEKGQPLTVDSLLRIATVFEITLIDLMGDLGHFPRIPPSAEQLSTTDDQTSSPVVKVKPAKTAQKKTPGN